MRKGPFAVILICTFLVEGLFCFYIYNKMTAVRQDSVAVNACLKEVEEHYGEEEYYLRDIEYTLLDNDGNVTFKTSEGLSESLTQAVANSDAVLDIECGGAVVGKMIINNSTSAIVKQYRDTLIAGVICIALIQSAVMAAYYIYLHKTIISPFRRLNDFAVRVAEGNLEVPLDVDRGHIFGSFSEAFDLMRTELKKARLAEKQANDAKKEMVAKLSHDIKTPVASIKSSSEIGYEISKDEKTKHYFNLINEKSDQVTALVANLFNSSINDITEIEVNPANYSSDILNSIIRNSDYLNRASEFTVPEADIYVDKLRLQQVFDNIFMNSYKYANTGIDVNVSVETDYLTVKIKDHGPGVAPEELPLLKEKYKRGGNASDKDGAGLGLFLSDYFITNMDGVLLLDSDGSGFEVTVKIRTL